MKRVHVVRVDFHITRFLEAKNNYSNGNWVIWTVLDYNQLSKRVRTKTKLLPPHI